MKNRWMKPLAAVSMCVAAMLGGPTASVAQSFDRPISLVVPYGTGGSDTWARMIAETMSKKIGQPVVVLNVPGANGAIGAARVARAKPDGYTILLLGLEVLTVNPVTLQDITYTPDDFRAVSILLKYGMMFVANKQTGIKNLDDLRSYALKNKAMYGALGTGSAQHLALMQFARATKLDFQVIPFQGVTQMMPELLSGRIPLSMISDASLKPLTDQLTAIGYTSTSRSPISRDVKTFVEQGLSDFVADLQYAVVVPKDTPSPIVNALQREIAATLGDPELKQKLEELGFEIVASSPADAEKVIAREVANMKQLTKDIGLSAAPAK